MCSHLAGVCSEAEISVLMMKFLADGVWIFFHTAPFRPAA